jgi:hypothetical protein
MQTNESSAKSAKDVVMEYLRAAELQDFQSFRYSIRSGLTSNTMREG